MNKNQQGFNPLLAVFTSESFLLALAGVIASAIVAQIVAFGAYQEEIAGLVFIGFALLAGIREWRDARVVLWRSRRLVVFATQEMIDAFETRTGRDIDDRAEAYLLQQMATALDALDPSTGSGSVLDNQTNQTVRKLEP